MNSPEGNKGIVPYPSLLTHLRKSSEECVRDWMIYNTDQSIRVKNAFMQFCFLVQEATISMIQLEELQRRITHNASYHLYKPRQLQISKCSPKRVIRL